MATKIYYFSSTGNSLHTARELARLLGDAEVVNIAKVFDTEKTVPGEAAGFVFPVYGFGAPRMVEEFVSRLRFNEKTYVFAVATCGGTPAGTLQQFGKLVKKNGGRLSAGFAVQQPGNCVTLYGGFSEEKKKELFRASEQRLPEIAAILKARQTELEDSRMMLKLIGKPMHRLAIKGFMKSDKNFWVNKKCINCRVCEKVCPRHNIETVGGKRQWKGNCEQCLACIQWCPKEAIQYKQKTEDRKRYHHPKVKVSDFYINEEA